MKTTTVTGALLYFENGTRKRIEFTAEDCCVVLMAVKLARENFKHKRDNLVDPAGYTEILYRIKEAEI